MMKAIRLSALALVLALTSGMARAVIIPYSLELTPTPDFGPAGVGTFDWDDSTFVVSNFSLTLGSFGPFPGGANDGAPLNLGPVFNGSSFTTQVAVNYSPYFTPLFLNTDGTYHDFNGRIQGGYSSVGTVSVPEPGTLGLLGVSLLGFAVLRHRRARHSA